MASAVRIALLLILLSMVPFLGAASAQDEAADAGTGPWAAPAADAPGPTDKTLCADGWDTGFGYAGLNATASAMIFSGGDLYVGGNFTVAGDLGAQKIARWDGAAWAPLGAGIGGVASLGGSVAALATDGGILYVGGSFNTGGATPYSGIASWDGTQWSTVGTGIGGNVEALAMHDGALYATGIFTSAGGAPASRIAKWDGTSWSALGSGINSTGLALVSYDGSLYVGGNFTLAGGIAVTNLARWDGTTWSAVPGVFNGAVETLTVSGTDLIVGGSFTTIDGATINRIARWDGAQWHALGAGVNNGVNNAVHSVAVDGSNIWVGGNMTTAEGSPAPGLARWDGTSWWSPADGLYGNGASAVVWTVTVGPGGRVYAGGVFTRAGEAPLRNIAVWDGAAWSSLGAGQGVGYTAADRILTLAERRTAAGGSEIIAAGDFKLAGGVCVNNIARWDEASRTWSPLGDPFTGPNGVVRVVAADSQDVYVGGIFTMVPGWSVNNIAKWDGTSWSRLWTGAYGQVEALAVCPNGSGGSDLYAGGVFTTAGGQAASRIAKWNGTAWSALGAGVNGIVEEIAVAPNGAGGYDVYAAGQFTQAGGLPANRVAKWDGAAWSALGDGVNGTVDAIAVMPNGSGGHDLYVGGYFTTAGGLPANRVARWDGAAWSPLGDGANGSVNAMTADGGRLYIGGGFTSVDGVAANGVAVWDGTAWSALGAGLPTSGLDALLVSGGSVYAGGLQSFAGCGVSFRFARFASPSSGTDLPPGTPKLLLGPAVPNPFNPATNLAFTMPAGGHAELAVFDLRGRRVATLVDGVVAAGEHSYRFDARGLASGLYFARLSTAAGAETRKMVLLR